MSIWIIAEQRNGRVQVISHELLARGRGLAEKRGLPLTAVLLGHAPEEELLELIHRGADQVILAEAAELEHFLPEPYMQTLEYLARKHQPEIVIAGATSTGRTLMPLLAVRLTAGLTADCTHLDIEAETGNLLQVRPAIGGNIMATIKSPAHRPQMATVRPRSMRPLAADTRRSGEIIRETIPAVLLGSRVRLVDFTRAESDGADIQEANVVVSGGRGMKRRENFDMIRRLANALNGAVGASREAVDRGWISYPHQVGLSGKTISPKLYLCAGVSGSVQHLAGIKTAENIIAINSDPEAQIFKVADLGVAADLFVLLPMIEKRLKALSPDKH